MKEQTNNIFPVSGFLNSNEKNFRLAVIFLIIFLCIAKLPALFSSDIQPWDEGMYASRVLSIHINGDFFDQSKHSVGGFYSGSHPPLLIWIGYAFTAILGAKDYVFKIIPFLFGVGSLVLLILIGRKLYDNTTGLVSGLIFSATILFEVFSKRFQFDIPYTFFILLSAYSIILYNNSNKFKHLLWCGISFGLCLMTKILVGIFIPIIITAAWAVLRKEINFKLKDILIIAVIGAFLALPWHLYMIFAYGKDFLNYFLGFHIIDRAFTGVEHNTKNSGALFHINYFFTIIPFGILAFISFFEDIKNYKILDWKKKFLWIWFLAGLAIITVFKTKLEVYLFLILSPGCILISQYTFSIESGTFKKRLLIFTLLIINILWYFSEYYRNGFKTYILNSNKVFLTGMLSAGAAIIFAVGYIAAKYIPLKKSALIIIVLFFLGSNMAYLFNPPSWDDTYELSGCRDYLLASGRKNLIYVASDYRYNPQLTYYFRGTDLGWGDMGMNFTMLDTKEGTESIKQKLKELPKGAAILVEKDNINRSVYPDSKDFIPAELKQVKKTYGYELYEN